MWEEIDKKQNEEEMLQLQYYARKLYDTSNIIFVIKMTVLMINAILAIININAIIVTILSIIYLVLECIEEKCIKNAANAREIFDAILFDFNIPKCYNKIKENAKKISILNKREFTIQKNNTGEDKPAGVKNWYTKNNGVTKNEIIFNCQVENTRWDEKVTKINSIIFWSIIVIMFIIYIIVKHNDSVENFIFGGLLAFEMVIQLVKIAIEYKKYNKNLIERNFEIQRIQNKKIKKDDLIILQELIIERRNLKLVPFNNIHKYITIKMHKLIKDK